MKNIVFTIIVSVCVLSAHAENIAYSADQPWYLNLNTGVATGYSFTNNAGSSENKPSGAATNNYSLGANIGYKFNQYVAAEIGYNNLWLASSPSNSGGQVGVEDIAAKGTLPLGDIFSLYGRLGVAGYQNIDNTDAGKFAHNIGVLYGAGAQWAASKNLAFQLEEWSVTGLGQNIIQVGASLSF